KREIRFSNVDDFYSNNRQLLLKYLPELHINLKTIAAQELQDLLKNSGLKITSATSNIAKSKQDSKTTGKDKSKQKSSSDNTQSTTPSNYSSNSKEFMNQLFNKSVGDGDVESEREQNNLVIVDNSNNALNETVQKSLLDTIIKITHMKSSSIILDWLNHFDILFSNYSYDLGNFGDEWINTSQYQQLLEKIDDIQKNAENNAAKVATKWVQEHYKEIAKYVPGQKGEKGDPGKPGRDGKDGKDGKDGEPGKDGKDGKDGEPGKDGKDGVGSGDMLWEKFNRDYFELENKVIKPKNVIDGYATKNDLKDKANIDDLVIDNNGKWKKQLQKLDMNERNIENIGVLAFSDPLSIWVNNKIYNFNQYGEVKGIKKISGLNPPLEDGDAANKKYIDDYKKEVENNIYTVEEVDKLLKENYPTQREFRDGLEKKANKDNTYTKEQVDNKISNVKVDTSNLQDKIFKKSDGGGEWSKLDKLPLGLNQSRISELKDPDADDDAATKKYVDSKTQDIITIKKDLQDKVNKTYFEDKIKELQDKIDNSGGGSWIEKYFKEKSNGEGLIFDGGRLFIGDDYAISEFFNKTLLIGGTDDNNLGIETGDTGFDGGVWLNKVKAPRMGRHATNKNYVDDRINLMFQELGFSKEQIQKSNEKVDQILASDRKEND
ncbi:MAG: hypothetical protein E7Y34_01530, partial [Mycoplasma sp.]|nr:hypothetical protein [Mycoplasma sp.]